MAGAPLVRFWRDYRQRHCYWPNALFHVVGVPLTIVAIYLAGCGRWFWAAAAMAVGYALQSFGHRLQGSEVGELALMRRILRRKKPAGPQ